MTTGRTALEGIRVLDVTQVMAGPFCAMQLCDMGADVIKVEPPEGDPTRQMGAHAGSDSAGFAAINRGKRGIVLDLKSAAGRQAFERLAARADILIENFRPGVMDHLGLGYAALSVVNPRLIYASISGYGQTGPDASKGGFDLVAQGVSGLMSVTGESGRPPIKSGVPLTDLGAGLFALAAILAALHHRHRTGRGQYIDTSLVEAGLALSVWEATEYFAGGVTPQALDPPIGFSRPIRRFDARMATSRLAPARTDCLAPSATFSGTRSGPRTQISPTPRRGFAIASRSSTGLKRSSRKRRRATGSSASRRPVFRAGRSTPTPTRLPIRRFWPAKWSSRSITPCSVRSGPWDRRSRCPRRRPSWAGVCLASASTLGRCCERLASARRRLSNWRNPRRPSGHENTARRVH